MSKTTNGEMTFTIQCKFTNGVYEDGPGVLSLVIDVDTLLDDVVDMLAAKHDLPLGPDASRQFKAKLRERLSPVAEPTQEMIEAGVDKFYELDDVVSSDRLVTEIFRAMLDCTPRQDQEEKASAAPIP
jgi:hypothetical protein